MKYDSSTHSKLVGGFKYFLFSPRKLGKMNPFWGAYFSIGLKPPTRNSFKFQITFLVKFYRSTFWFSIGHTTMEPISPKDLSCVSGGLRPSRWLGPTGDLWVRKTLTRTHHGEQYTPQVYHGTQKMMDSKRNLLFQGVIFRWTMFIQQEFSYCAIFRFHVKPWEGKNP